MVIRSCVCFPAGGQGGESAFFDGDFDHTGDLIAQLALDVIGAKGFDGLTDQFGLGDVEAILLLDGIGDLLGGDAAEQLLAGACLGGDYDRAVLQFLGQLQSGFLPVPGVPYPSVSGC